MKTWYFLVKSLLVMTLFLLSFKSYCQFPFPTGSDYNYGPRKKSSSPELKEYKKQVKELQDLINKPKNFDQNYDKIVLSFNQASLLYKQSNLSDVTSRYQQQRDETQSRYQQQRDETHQSVDHMKEIFNSYLYDKYHASLEKLKSEFLTNISLDLDKAENELKEINLIYDKLLWDKDQVTSLEIQNRQKFNNAILNINDFDSNSRDLERLLNSKVFSFNIKRKIQNLNAFADQFNSNTNQVNEKMKNQIRIFQCQYNDLSKSRLIELLNSTDLMAQTINNIPQIEDSVKLANDLLNNVYSIDCNGQVAISATDDRLISIKQTLNKNKDQKEEQIRQREEELKIEEEQERKRIEKLDNLANNPPVTIKAQFFPYYEYGPALFIGTNNLTDKDISEIKCVLYCYNSGGQSARSYISGTNSGYYISQRTIYSNNSEVEYVSLDEFYGVSKCKLVLINVKFSDGSNWKSKPNQKVVFESTMDD